MEDPYRCMRGKLVDPKFPNERFIFSSTKEVYFFCTFGFDCLVMFSHNYIFFLTCTHQAHPLEASLDSLDPDMMYLVHLRPKARISEVVLGWEELPKFIAFLKQMTRVKRVRLIPKMEWVQKSWNDIHLISKHYQALDPFLLYLVSHCDHVMNYMYIFTMNQQYITSICPYANLYKGWKFLYIWGCSIDIEICFISLMNLWEAGSWHSTPFTLM